MRRVVDPARDGIIVECAATMLEPSQNAHSCRLEQFKLHRTSGLHEHRTHPDAATADEITYSDLHHVIDTKFAVDGEVEQRSIAVSALPLEPKANGPNLLGLQRPLGAYDASGIPGPSLSRCEIVKADASYFSVPTGGSRSVDVIWTYETPFEEVSAIKDHLAFYPDMVASII